MPETLIVAVITAVVSIVGAWIAASATAHKAKAEAATAADALYASLCKDLMSRINMLTAQLAANQVRIEGLEAANRSAQMRIAELEAGNDRLTTALSGAQEQIDKLEQENETLRAVLKSLKQTPPTRRASAKGAAV